MQTNKSGCPRYGNSKKVLSTLVILCATVLVQAQNLVPNGSFENYTNCPTSNSFYGKVTDWYNPNTASPDYFNPCGITSTIPGHGSQLFGYQLPRTGTSLAGAGWYGLGGGFYDYIQVQFSQPLVSGETYKVSFWVSLANNVQFASDDIGAYISDLPFKSNASVLPATITNVVATTPASFGVFTTLTPQIKVVDNSFVEDTLNWVEITGLYVSHGGEQAITIGCFEPWTTTGTKIVNPTAGGRSYYFIDDVSVENTNTLPVELVSFDATRRKDGNVELSWKTASEQNVCRYEVERASAKQSFQQIHTTIAAGNSTTVLRYNHTDDQPVNGLAYYRVRAVDCDGAITYSKIVTVKTKALEMAIFPNPVQQELTVSFNDNTAYPIRVVLLDIVGNPVFETNTFSNEKLSLSMDHLAKGVYILEVHSAQNETVVKKIIKK